MAVLKLADQVGAGREGSGGLRPGRREGPAADGRATVSSGGGSRPLPARVVGGSGRPAALPARPRAADLSRAVLTVRAARELQLRSGKWRWAGGCERC